MTNVISVICDDYNDDSIKDLTKIKKFLLHSCFILTQLFKCVH